MKQITKDWLDAASMDIESIECLLQNERLTGHVAFPIFHPPLQVVTIGLKPIFQSAIPFFLHLKV
jgi:hypothetical protein